MGNLQGTDKKSSKSGKSGGKSALSKLGNRKSPAKEKLKKEEFTSIVPEEDYVIEEHKKCVVPSKAITVDDEEVTGPDHIGGTKCKKRSVAYEEQIPSSTNTLLNNNQQQQQVTETAEEEVTTVENDQIPNKIVDKKGQENVPRITPTSQESSSDSIFCDPLTPDGFAAELNQCYRSEESVNKTITPLNNFKLNEYETKINKQKSQSTNTDPNRNNLSISKTSLVSVNFNENFVSENVLLFLGNDETSCSSVSDDVDTVVIMPASSPSSNMVQTSGETSPTNSFTDLGETRMVSSSTNSCANVDLASSFVQERRLSQPSGGSFVLTRYKKVDLAPKKAIPGKHK